MDALSSLGNFFSSGAGKGLESLATLGATGAGLAGNLSAEHQRQQELNYAKQQQALLANPTALASEVAGATQPLNKALVESVGNNVTGTLAEEGLSQAPGIQATALSQALAPYEQQNQQTALQIVMQRLGLPLNYAQTILAGNPGQTNLAPLMALFKNMGTPASSSGMGYNPAALIKLLQSANMPAQQTSSSQLPDWLTPTTDSSNIGDFNIPQQISA